jgi:hypothetical protein
MCPEQFYHSRSWLAIIEMETEGWWNPVPAGFQTSRVAYLIREL